MQLNAHYVPFTAQGPAQLVLHVLNSTQPAGNTQSPIKDVCHCKAPTCVPKAPTEYLYSYHEYYISHTKCQLSEYVVHVLYL